FVDRTAMPGAECGPATHRSGQDSRCSGEGRAAGEQHDHDGAGDSADDDLGETKAEQGGASVPVRQPVGALAHDEPPAALVGRGGAVSPSVAAPAAVSTRDMIWCLAAPATATVAPTTAAGPEPAAGAPDPVLEPGPAMGGVPPAGPDT